MSLHTRYRPKTFDEVIGQGHIIPSLKKVVGDRHSHAFLFVGPSGVGKTTLARILANQFTEGKGTKLNVTEIDSADLTGVADIRNLVSSTSYRALGVSPIRVIILDEVHRLSYAAWQALLKPLEEPPEHVFWCLCTTELGKIPKTILTRCLRYDLKLVDDLEIFDLLKLVAQKEKLDVTEAVLEVCAEEACGSPRHGLVNLVATHGAATTATDARRLLRAANSSPDVLDLCRWLTQGSRGDWGDGMRFVSAATANSDAESIRIVVSNYIAAVLCNTKSASKALRLLQILEAFSTPYNQSDKLAPLLLSVGVAMGLNQ